MTQTLFRQLVFTIALAIPSVSLNAQTALADQRDFTIENNNELAIVEVYVSAGNSQYWGSDILKGTIDILPSGEESEIGFSNSSNQCVYDIKVVYENGTYDMMQQANLCEITSVSFEGNGGNYR